MEKITCRSLGLPLILAVYNGFLLGTWSTDVLIYLAFVVYWSVAEEHRILSDEKTKAARRWARC